jgi:hypothetical protein
MKIRKKSFPFEFQRTISNCNAWLLVCTFHRRQIIIPIATVAVF